jgi:quinol monooxygenase YgiN
MIVVFASAIVQTDAIETVMELAKVCAETTRQESGCLSYAFYISVENPNQFIAFEEWKDSAALEAHLQTEHVQTFFAGLTPHLTAPPQITRYEVAGREAL